MRWSIVSAAATEESMRGVTIRGGNRLFDSSIFPLRTTNWIYTLLGSAHAILYLNPRVQRRLGRDITNNK